MPIQHSALRPRNYSIYFYSLLGPCNPTNRNQIHSHFLCTTFYNLRLWNDLDIEPWWQFPTFLGSTPFQISNVFGQLSSSTFESFLVVYLVRGVVCLEIEIFGDQMLVWIGECFFLCNAVDGRNLQKFCEF